MAAAGGLEEVVDVVVVGAGLAGLTAARSLVRAGVARVALVEAGGAPGGRVRQVRGGLAPWPLEAGPEFVHGGSRSVLKALLDEFGLKTREHAWPDKFWFARRPVGERWVDDPESDPSVARADDIFERMVGETSAADRTIAEHLAATSEPREVVDVAEAAYANDFGTSLDRMGVFEITEEARHWSYDESYLVVEESLGVLVDRMAEGLDLRLNTAVEEIVASQGSDHVVVRTRAQQLGVGRDGAGLLRCRHCVVTVPHAMLQEGTPRFSPPLPAHKRDALVRVGMGNAIKVFCVFSERVWPEGFFDVICPGAFVPEFWVTPHTRTTDCEASASGEHVITAFLAGKAADHAKVLTRDEIVRRTIAQLDEMFAEMPGAPGYRRSRTPASDRLRATHVEDWSGAKWVRGAYTYPSAHAAGARAALAMPSHGRRIFYAGEATNANANPCMQAAIETGHRAAAECLLARAPPRPLL